MDTHAVPFKERVYTHYQKEMARLEKIVQGGDQEETSENEEYRDPLSMDVRKEVTILLSWGGPSDGYKVYFDQNGEAVEGFYFFADWFEYEEIKLTETELERVLAIYPVV